MCFLLCWEKKSEKFNINVTALLDTINIPYTHLKCHLIDFSVAIDLYNHYQFQLQNIFVSPPKKKDTSHPLSVTSYSLSLSSHSPVLIYFL